MLKGTSVFTFCGICATCKKGKLIGSGGNGRVTIGLFIKKR